MARPSKKPKPTFDVAREPLPPTRSGWVYRSDSAEPTPPAVPAPAADETGKPQVLEPLEAAHYQPPRERGTPNHRVETPSEWSWLQTGVYLMVLPVSFGMTLMFAPVTWLLGGRSRR